MVSFRLTFALALVSLLGAVPAGSDVIKADRVIKQRGESNNLVIKTEELEVDQKEDNFIGDDDLIMSHDIFHEDRISEDEMKDILDLVEHQNNDAIVIENDNDDNDDHRRWEHDGIRSTKEEDLLDLLKIREVREVDEVDEGIKIDIPLGII